MFGLNAHGLRHINLVRPQLNTHVKLKWMHESKSRLSITDHHWAAMLDTLCSMYPNFSLNPPPLSHSHSFPYPFSLVKDRQRMCLWLGKTHISSLRFHIPGIPSEDHCSPFKTIPHMEGGKKKERDPGQPRSERGWVGFELWEFVSLKHITLPVSVNEPVVRDEWEVTSFRWCGLPCQKSHHDWTPVITLRCGNSKS